MGAPGNKEKAVRLLKLAIQNQITSQTISSSTLSCSLDESTANNMSCNRYSNLSNGKNRLAQCFDQVSSPEPFYVLECEEYLNSTTNIDENDDDNSKLFFRKRFLSVKYYFDYVYAFLFSSRILDEASKSISKYSFTCTQSISYTCFKHGGGKIVFMFEDGSDR